MKFKLFTPFINPVEWIRARRFRKKTARFEKSSFDLELYLYSKILTNNMLHWGYFKDPSIRAEDISISRFEEAQIDYARLITEQIGKSDFPVLDVGCGMGGLGKLLSEIHPDVELLTPNRNQIEFLRRNMGQLKSHHTRFEDFGTETRYGTVINSESLQYIALDTAFDKVEALLKPGGKWVIVDYFRLSEQGINKTAHLLNDFLQMLSAKGWEIVVEKDITENVLPTARLINLYIERFLIPLKHFAWEKLRFKRAGLYYLSRRLRGHIDEKIAKETASVDPKMFEGEKKYLFFVLQKR